MVLEKSTKRLMKKTKKVFRKTVNNQIKAIKEALDAYIDIITEQRVSVDSGDAFLDMLLHEITSRTYRIGGWK